MPRISVVTPTLRVAGLQRVYEALKRQTFQDYEWLVEINTSGKTDFNQAMNKMIARAKGDIIVSVQDYIAIPDNALEYIASLPPNFYTFPVGKIRQEGDTPVWDWRTVQSRPVNFMEWEICFGSAPRQALIDIGGFDEALDLAWGFDNVNVGQRAELDGHKILCDNTIKAIAIDHDFFEEHPLKHLRDEALHNQRIDMFRRGERINHIARYMV